MPLPIATWNASLAEIEQALTTTLAELDTHAARCAICQAETCDPPPRSGSLKRWDERLTMWDRRLAAATSSVDAIQAALEERFVELHHWQDRLANWRRLIEQA